MTWKISQPLTEACDICNRVSINFEDIDDCLSENKKC